MSERSQTFEPVCVHACVNVFVSRVRAHYRKLLKVSSHHWGLKPLTARVDLGSTFFAGHDNRGEKMKKEKTLEFSQMYHFVYMASVYEPNDEAAFLRLAWLEVHLRLLLPITQKDFLQMSSTLRSKSTANPQSNRRSYKLFPVIVSGLLGLHLL